MSTDILTDKIRAMRNPTVMGLDPKPEYIPPSILEKSFSKYGKTLRGLAEAYFEFNAGLIDALGDAVPAVKLQSACYEAAGWEGVEILHRTVQYARQAGMYVIVDGKRNDIGTSADAYSSAYLGRTEVGGVSLEPFGADALTINAYLGSDGVKPFLEDCRRYGKCVFALVKTSNPSSMELQDMLCGDRMVYKVVAARLELLGSDIRGSKYGFSELGMVVGATHPRQLSELRSAMPKVFFLVPGYGAQGGQAQDVEKAFTKEGHGAIINSSRAIMCAWKTTGGDGGDYKDAARAEALKMRDEIKRFVVIV